MIDTVDARLLCARSFLFVPADHERRLASAFRSGADAVVVDLEDAVPPEAKEPARVALRSLLAAPDGRGPAVVLRVNGHDAPWWREDLEAAVELGVDAVMVPKATPEALAAVPDGVPPVIALVETAVGLRLSYESASAPNVFALALGAADLGVELLWRPRPDNAELLYARSRLVLDSAAAGLRPPIDVVRPDVRDADGLRAEAGLAADLGLTGKMCIHPAQIPVVNDAFTPDPAEIRAALRVVQALNEAAAAGRAVTTVDGRLVDAPVAARARRLTSLAQTLDAYASGPSPA